MNVQRIPFSRFSELLGHTLAIDEDVDFGSGWFAAQGDRLLGRLSVNLVTEKWSYEVYRATAAGWLSADDESGFESYADAYQHLMRSLHTPAAASQAAFASAS